MPTCRKTISSTESLKLFIWGIYLCIPKFQCVFNPNFMVDVIINPCCDSISSVSVKRTLNIMVLPIYSIRPFYGGHISCILFFVFLCSVKTVGICLTETKYYFNTVIDSSYCFGSNQCKNGIPPVAVPRAIIHWFLQHVLTIYLPLSSGAAKKSEIDLQTNTIRLNKWKKNGRQPWFIATKQW